MKTILVFFGGKSVEHDISVITGVMTVNALKEKFNALPVYIDKTGKWFTGELLNKIDNFKKLDYKKLKRICFIDDNQLYEIKGKRLKKLYPVSIAINCMHGERGEDGSLIGLLKMLGVPFCSPDILPSSVCMDKIFTKIALKGLNVKTLKGIKITNAEDLIKVKKELTYPVIVKPNKLGSSIGISKVNNDEELYSAVNYALKFGAQAVAEKCLDDFIEINCACYNDGEKIVVSACERPIGRTNILTFNDKYESGKRVFPADIDEKTAKKIQNITKKIYENFDIFGVIRVDYFISDGEILVNEINTVPGSLSYYLFGETIEEFKIMLEKMIARALSLDAQSKSFETDFNSGILSLKGVKGIKK